MVKVMVVVGVREGVPALGAAETLCEAIDRGGSAGAVRVVLIGSQTRAAAGALGGLGFGDLEMCLAETEAFSPGRWAHALAGEIDDGIELVVLPASADGRDLAPRLAAQLDRPLIAGALRIGSDHAIVSRAGGRAMAEIAIDSPIVATLQVGCRSVPRRSPRESLDPVELAEFELGADIPDVVVTSVEGPQAATMDLAEAPFIVGAGIGLGSVEYLEALERVAEALGASVGATRVVTDEGWLGHDRQIGSTGVVVNPKVYVAFGISGAVQHTSGLGAPEHVLSVNTDAHCPMMKLAELAIVADARAVVSELERLVVAPTKAPSGHDTDSKETST